MNKTTLVGRVGSVELVGNEGKSVLKMSLAVNERWKNSEGEKQERTDWLRLVIFGSRAEALAPHVEKGSLVAVSGKIRTGSYEKEGVKHYTTDVVVDEFEFLGGGKGKSNDSPDSEGRPEAGSDEIPFD